MTDSNDTNADGIEKPISGSMFLYGRPEPLNVQDHGDLGLSPPEQPFGHVRNQNVVPLTMTEFGSALRHFPIVFSATDETAVPLAVLGIADGENLFVNDKGEWDPMVYIPSYLRCYPFALARANGDNMTPVIDRAASSIQENPQFPFFEGDQLTEQTNKFLEFCVQYEQARVRTRQFAQLLAEHQLIVPQQATRQEPGAEQASVFATYNSIDSEKLTNIADDKLPEWHRTGLLSAMYLQLYSVENWRHLMARRLQQQAARNEANDAA